MIKNVRWLGLAMLAVGCASVSPQPSASPDVIAFATAPIGDGTRPSSQNQFNDSDRIYGRFYLSGPLSQCRAEAESPQTYRFHLSFDGAAPVNWLVDNVTITEEIAAQRSRPVALNPADDAETSATWLSFVEALSPGSHQVTLALYGMRSEESSAPCAVGSFTLRRSAGRTPLKIGKTFDSYLGGLNEPATEAAALSLVQAVATKAKWPQAFSKVKLVDAGWVMERHPRTGVLIGRSIGAVGFSRFTDGHCEALRFGLDQQHDGRDFSGPMVVGSLGTGERIDCD